MLFKEAITKSYSDNIIMAFSRGSNLVPVGGVEIGIFWKENQKKRNNVDDSVFPLGVGSRVDGHYPLSKYVR